jgi:hypothetical protein
MRLVWLLRQSLSVSGGTSSKAETHRNAQQSSRGRESHPKTLLKPPTRFHFVSEISFSWQTVASATFSPLIRFARSRD